MIHGSLFSGIGGFDLAAEWMGWTNAFHCEWEEFPRKVLQYHFPESKSYGDINETDFTIWNKKIDILTGGFPCQPYSAAGKRLGKEDERHLWPEMLRAIREIEPRWIIGENVYGLVSWNDGMVFEEVQVDLENEGYEVEPYILPAASVNALHRRDRVWFVAYSKSQRAWKQPSKNRGWENRRSYNNGEKRNATNTNNERLEGEYKPIRYNEKGRQIQNRCTKQYASASWRALSAKTWENFPTQSPVCGRDDGIPRELDSITFPKWRNESIKAYGNAIVPQVAYQLFKTIRAYEIQRDTRS